MSFIKGEKKKKKIISAEGRLSGRLASAIELKQAGSLFMLTQGSNALDNIQKYETQYYGIKQAEQQPINFYYWVIHVFVYRIYTAFGGADKVYLFQLISAIKHFVFIWMFNSQLTKKTKKTKDVSQAEANELKWMNFKQVR